MVIGHNIKLSNKLYDMQCHPRMAQDAADGMQSWRAAVLQSQTPTVTDLTWTQREMMVPTRPARVNCTTNAASVNQPLCKAIG